jgi:hypothetical protein
MLTKEQVEILESIPGFLEFVEQEDERLVDDLLRKYPQLALAPQANGIEQIGRIRSDWTLGQLQTFFTETVIPKVFGAALFRHGKEGYDFDYTGAYLKPVTGEVYLQTTSALAMSYHPRLSLFGLLGEVFPEEVEDRIEANRELGIEEMESIYARVMKAIHKATVVDWRQEGF